MLYTGLLRESGSRPKCDTHLCRANRHAYTNANRHTNSDTIGHAKRNAHSHSHSHGDNYTHSYSNSYAHFNAKGPSARSSNATPAPDTLTPE